MSFTFRRAAAAVAVLAASATVLVAAPANAERVTYKDAAGDVVETTYTEDYEDTVTPAPTWTSTDIRATRISHDRAGVKIVVRTATATPRLLMSTAFIRTPRKRVAIMWSKAPGFGSDTIFFDMKDPEAECTGAAMKISKSRKLVTMTVPARCLGNPVTVRVGLGLSAMGTGDGSYDDDALRTGLSAYGVPKLSKSLSRG